ncbi:MAG: hypothetical protein HRT69_05280 [Flavobacteriaceae bacterium]|nr:hypothetical protein [Flavobacteriaceae bacterium]
MNASILKTGLLSLALTAAFVTPTFGDNTVIETVEINTRIKNEVKITIDKNTQDSEFKEIVKTLKKHNIEARFSGIKRNKNNEIVAIKIKLKDDNGNESTTSLSSENPINTITLGAENNSLYITSSNSKNFSFNGTHSLSEHFDFSFNDDEHKMTINGKTFDFDDIKKQIKDAFVFEEDADGKRLVIKLNNFDFNLNFDDEDDDGTGSYKTIIVKPAPKFHFVDDPEIEKYIIINGKKANFKKLDELAKSDQLKSVDFLRPDTAQSLYGKKAKDGAIIATTK